MGLVAEPVRVAEAPVSPCADIIKPAWDPRPPPTYFHAVFEAYVGGRWVMIGLTGMTPIEHVVRIATGSDAKNGAFATTFGPARMTSMFHSTLSLGDITTARPLDTTVRQPRRSRA